MKPLQQIIKEAIETHGLLISPRLTQNEQEILLIDLITLAYKEGQESRDKEFEKLVESMVCGICKKHGVNTYGECHCSYDGMEVINKQKLLQALKENNHD